MSIGEKIRSRRTDIGMSQEKLAYRLGFASKSSIGKVESGERGIDAEMLPKYAEALNTSVDFLLNIEQPKQIKLTEEENNLLEMFRNMNESQQFAVITLAEQLAEKYIEEEKRG